jgi:crotonobetainyl-CoA:carnitine CoA-transferase CaiB-like acyl-CoA transferase
VVKVVDLSCDVAGRFAAKLLAMAGLEVVRAAASDQTALSRYLDAHKRRVPFPDDDAGARALLGDADVVFTSFDRGRYVAPGSHAALRSLAASCVEVTTSSFGTTGPYAGWRGGPLADWAAGGYLAITGWPDREPLIGPEQLCGYVAGYTAAIAAEAALQERRRSGRGRHVDLSTMEAMLNVHQSTFSRLAAGVLRVRTGRYTELYPLVVRPCRDGYVSLGVVSEAEFDRLAIAIGREDLVTDARFRDAAARWEHRDALDAELEGFLRERGAEGVVELLLAHGLATAKVADAHEVLHNPQLAHRGFWEELETESGRVRVPGNPLPPATVLARGPKGPSPGARSRLAAGRRGGVPLAGITVLDLTTFWAGPSATRLLGDLGARVIWVERPGSRREPGPGADGAELVMHCFHLKMNRNKHSVVLDLGAAGGRELARRLAAEADVLVENFRPGALEGVGLGAADLCAAHPALVYVSLSGFGHTGPWSERRSYGPTIEAASSIEARTGYPDGEPLRLGHTLPDGVGGLVGALAALRGLRERDERGGVGGWFDVSQLEAYVAVSGEELWRAATTGRPLPRIGNRSRCGALQGVFPCAGEDQWLAIRLADASDVERLARVAGLPGLVAAAAATPRDDAAVEQTIARFSSVHDKRELAVRLQLAGLEAFAVLTPPELVADAHLGERGFFLDVPCDGGRALRLPGSPLHGLADPVGAAPRFGEHTGAIVDLLGAGESRSEHARRRR